MKKNVFLAAALLALMAAVLPAQTDSEGTPGLKYTLLKDGKGYSVEKGKVKTSVVVIPESYNNLPVTAIAKKAFSSSTITGITIPDSVTDIGEQAFKSCAKLTGITIPASVTTVGNGAFSRSGLTGITIPDNITNIEEEAFEGCKNLTSVTIGNGLTSIGKQTFKDCKSLTSVTIPNSVNSIGVQAFQGCKSLTGVTIPNSVIRIWHSAFSETGLTSITIPASVISIGEYPSGTASLVSTLDRTATSMGENAFISCESLTAINVDAGNAFYSSQDGVLYDKNKTFLIRYPEAKTGSAFTIPDSVTEIGTRAFLGCKLKSITIPNGVTIIRAGAFGYCTSLTSVTFQGGSINTWELTNFMGDEDSPYPIKLRQRYFDRTGFYNTQGGAGTYTRESGGNVWSKQ